MAVFIESWLYVRKTDLLDKPSKAGLRKRKRDNDGVKRDTPPHRDGKGHVKADPPPDIVSRLRVVLLLFLLMGRV